MKTLCVVVLFLAASIPYFKYQRAVQLASGAQQYVIVDETIWQHARPDLQDVRLFAGSKEVPYAVVITRGSAEVERKDVPVLQQSTMAGKTQFLVDMSKAGEYSHVDLKLATKNYVAHAQVEAADDAHATNWARLGDGILYDLSTERLGSNSVLRLPVSRFKYLRITIDGPVTPKDVQGASTELGLGQPPIYRNLGATPRLEQRGKDTVYTVEIAANIPVERITFVVDPAQPNFWRSVEVKGEKQEWLGSGDISRVHMNRNGRKIESEVSEVSLSTRGHRKIEIAIHNGDDPPLKITSVRLEQYERRLYFDAPSQAQQVLYYGDEKLEQPSYDYARLFAVDNAAGAAQLGAESVNSAFTQRPDDRPWSDKHPAVLWSAIVAAVLVLGAIAIRTIKS